MAVLWLLSTFIFESYVGDYIIAPAISFEAAMFKNYVASYFWIWKDRVKKKKGDFFKRLFYYNLSTVFVFLIKLGILLIVERLTHLDVIWCNLIALSVSGIINLYAQDKLVFKPSGSPSNSSA